jgi:hypothetical protein
VENERQEDKTIRPHCDQKMQKWRTQRFLLYATCRLSLLRSFKATCAAASLAMGTRNGEQLT